MARKREKLFEIEFLPEGFAFCENPESVSLELKAAVIQDFDTKKIYVVADVEREREALEEHLSFTYPFPLCADPVAINNWLQSNETFLCTLPAGFKVVEGDDENYLQCEFGRVDQDDRAYEKLMKWITKTHNSLFMHFLQHNKQQRIGDHFVTGMKMDIRNGDFHISGWIPHMLALIAEEASEISEELRPELDFLKKIDEQFDGEEIDEAVESMAETIVDELLGEEAMADSLLEGLVGRKAG